MVGESKLVYYIKNWAKRNSKAIPIIKYIDFLFSPIFNTRIVIPINANIVNIIPVFTLNQGIVL